jgi:hypothetical protein
VKQKSFAGPTLVLHFGQTEFKQPDLLKSNAATAYNSTYVHRRLGRRLGLRGAAARRSATWPFALVGLRATSHTCDSLCAIAQHSFHHFYTVVEYCGVFHHRVVVYTLKGIAHGVATLVKERMEAYVG